VGDWLLRPRSKQSRRRHELATRERIRDDVRPRGAEGNGVSPAAPDDPTITAVGPPGAPAIVFVHGTRLSRAAWAAQLEGLGGEFRAIAMDLPAHGSRADEPFTLARAADLLADTIRDEASGGRAVVVGLSLGGYVAMALAARQPQRIRGLVLAGASAEPVGLRSLPYRALAVALDRFEGPALTRLNAWFFRTRYPAEIAEPIVAGGFWSKGGASALRTLFGQRFVPRLAAYSGPTLILNGQWDLLFRLSAGAFAEAAADARRVRLAGALHLSNLDQPAAFNEAVRRFARSLGVD
jgi:pimeloyl-ACP methyl ester carboxylesterase